MQYILKCKNFGSSTYMSDLQSQICKIYATLKTKTNTTITFTIDHTHYNSYCFSQQTWCSKIYWWTNYFLIL